MTKQNKTINQVQQTSKLIEDASGLPICEVKSFKSLSDMQSEFVLFTDALMYSVGKLRRDMLRHFAHDQGLPPNDRPISVNVGRKVFDAFSGFLARDLQHTIYAIKKEYWQDLRDYFCGIAPFSFASGFFAKFNCHDLDIPDYCLLNTCKRDNWNTVPFVTIKSVAVFSNEGTFLFESPKLPALMCPIKQGTTISTIREDQAILFMPEKYK